VSAECDLRQFLQCSFLVNKEIFKTLQSKNLGINLLNCRDDEFFKTADERFDVVSLDYFGQLKNQEIEYDIERVRITLDTTILPMDILLKPPIFKQIIISGTSVDLGIHQN